MGPYETYLLLLDEAQDLPARLQEARRSAEEAGSAELKAAELALRVRTAEVERLNEQLNRLRGPIHRLASASGCSVHAVNRVPQPIESLEGAERLIQSLAADLRAAETAWEWIQRTSMRSSNPTPPDHQVPAEALPVTSAEPPRQEQRSPAPILVGVVVGAVILVLLVLAVV